MRAYCFLLAFALAVMPVRVSANVNRIAAVVNGEMITMFDLQAEIAPEMLRLGLDPKKSEQAQTIQKLSSDVLNGMINTIILTQEAERLKIMATDGDVDAEIQKIMQRNQLTPEDLKRQLQLQRLTEPTFRQRIRNTILRNRLLANMVGRKVVVTKNEIATYYEDHQKTFMGNQEVRFAIVVYPPSANAEQYASRIASGKTSFEQVARDVSVGPKPQEGGDVGKVHWDDLDPSWKELMASLKPGQVSPLVNINGLKGQLKLLELSGGTGLSLEEATPQIEAILREPKLQERFNEYSEQLRKRAVVEIRM